MDHKEHSQEWCDEMKKICEFCKKTSWYCLDHEPWKESKTAVSWGTMHHQHQCPLYLQLKNEDTKIQAMGVVRFCAIVQVNWTEPGFKGHDIKCPDCDGWDVTITKGM